MRIPFVQRFAVFSFFQDQRPTVTKAVGGEKIAASICPTSAISVRTLPANCVGALLANVRPAIPTMVSHCATSVRHSSTITAGALTVGPAAAPSQDECRCSGWTTVLAELLFSASLLKKLYARPKGSHGPCVCGRESGYDRGPETCTQLAMCIQQMNYCCSRVNWRIPDLARSSIAFNAS